MSGLRKVFVTSDWHLGGTVDSVKEGKFVAGTQICRALPELTAFIHWVASHGKEVPTELVINGDMVDFLAPTPDYNPAEWIADEAAAINRLDQIIASTGGANGPFGALKQLVATPNCSLSILLGNHDVELSLPRVRGHLFSCLAAEAGRVRFIFDGEALTIGRLLIEHGNRYDSVNVVDHTGLRQERSHVSRGLPVAEANREDRYFRPPAGTLFVVHVFNRLLEKYPFLNLLKPETAAALPLMIALDPDIEPVLENVLKLRPAKRRIKRGRLRGPADPSSAGNLAAQATEQKAGQPEPIDCDEEVEVDSLSELLGREIPVNPAGVGIGNLAAADVQGLSLRQRLAKSVTAFVGKWKDRADVLRVAVESGNEERLKNLHHCLQKTQSHQAFDFAREEAEYLDSAKAIIDTGRYDVVVFGHTHMPKKISHGEGKCYVNAGAWCGVMKLPPGIYAEFPQAKAALVDFLSKLVGGQIEQYIQNDLCYAAIDLKDGHVVCAPVCRYTRENPQIVVAA